MLNNSGVISAGALKGVTANRNITAFSLAIKLPFAYYLLQNQINIVISKFIYICLTLTSHYYQKSIFQVLQYPI